MPPVPQTARLALAPRLHELGESEQDNPAAEVVALIEPILQAAVELANAADAVSELAPGDLDPVVLRRYRLAELHAARDAFVDAAGDLIVGEAPIVEAEEEPDA